MKYLIKYNITVDYLNYCLNISCYHGYIKIVKHLIKKGADGLNAGLCYACSKGQLNIIRLLIENGATTCNACNKSMQEHLQ